MISQAFGRQLVKNIRPEGELLLCCISPELDETTNKCIKTLVEQKLDWDYLLKIAEKHRVVALLYRSLNLTCPQAVPQDRLCELRSRFLDNSKKNLLLTQELFRLLDQLQELNIRAIPYKGTVLAGSIYGKLSLRQVYDIDIIIDRQDFLRTKELLLSRGYRIQEEFDQEQSFVHEQNKVEVDVHWGFTPIYFPLKVDFEQLWKNTELVNLGQRTIVSLSTEDLLFILCIQVAKDSWERRQRLEHLAKVCDIAELIHVRPQLNWLQVREQAKTQGAIRMFHFGLFLAKDLLGVALPQQVLLETEGDSVAISLARQVCADLFGKEDETPSPTKNSLFDLKLRIRQLVFYLRMRERLEHKIKHFLEIFKLILSTV